MRTKDQKLAEAAYSRVIIRKNQPRFNFAEYVSFAMSFPTLIHTCGLVQAVAFAEAKNMGAYVEDLHEVFKAIDVDDDIHEMARSAELAEYTRISRHALSASTWIKRYCQAMKGDNDYAV